MLPQSYIATEFLKRAEQFYDTFRNAREQFPISWPRYYLLCHATELTLKAFLAWNGLEEDKLRSQSLGHNIKALLRRGETLGLRLSLIAKSKLSEMHEPHIEHRHRYPKTTGKSVVVADHFVPHFLELLRLVRVVCRGSDHDLDVKLEDDLTELKKIDFIRNLSA